MAAFAKGQTVSLKVTVPTGQVTKLRMDDDGVITYLVEWSDANGITHERWFSEDELVAG